MEKTPEQLKKEIKTHQDLDKYYTKSSVALSCYQAFRELLITKYDVKKLFFLEPSAGGGVFLDQIKEEKIGFDLMPTESKHNIIKHDFLFDDANVHLTTKKKIIIIGNPPFGLKAKLAIDFVNQGLNYSNVVGFIVPIQFRKWSVQSKINKNAKLIMDLDLQENAFEFLGKDYKVRCCFQVWSLESFDKNDLRIQTKPKTDHQDFEMYQFNRTEEAKKFFDYEWDFAVPRQGYQDYNFKATDKKSCDQKKQWIFFKAKTQKVLKRLRSIDFEKLSKKNIGIPGFGKADVVLEYESLWPSKK